MLNVNLLLSYDDDVYLSVSTNVSDMLVSETLKTKYFVSELLQAWQ